MASGILNVDKPEGPTSFGVVRSLKRLPGVTKIGHGGTLDPAAQGVLPVLVNAATRLADFIHEWPKTYLATVVFGAISDTGDREGTITPGGDTADFTAERIEQVLPRFIGRIQQVPPAYAAIKRDGEAAYHKIRRGEAVVLDARPVEIHRLSLLDYDAERATARLEIDSGRGMYVRSLARDLGDALGCGAYLAALTRTAVGPLHIDAATLPERLLAMGEEWTNALLPMDLPLQAWPVLHLDEGAAAMVRRGQRVAAPDSAAGRYRMLDERGQLVAWGEVQGGLAQPRAVFMP